MSGEVSGVCFGTCEILKQAVILHGIFSHKKFRAAYDFLLLREQSGEKLEHITMWWTQFQISDERTQAQMIKDRKPPSNKKNTGQLTGKLQIQ